MIIASTGNKDVLIQLAPSIQADLDGWQIVIVRTTKKDPDYSRNIVKKLAAAYVDKDGLIVQKADHNIVMLVNLGAQKNYIELRSELEKHLPDHSSHLTVRKMSLQGLRRLKNDLHNKDPEKTKNIFYDKRLVRKDNIFMIADDDMFLRKTIGTAIKKYGTVFEADNGNGVVEEYQKSNPDLLFLDIHMPGKTGIELIDDILDHDPDAHIVMLSADSVKTNILQAIEKGAHSFLTKPASKEKLLEILQKCPTVAM
ncbi:MAG: response regulator [Alphaproteobacteria bacterium]|nr:MAG: response regulator [Alphaproteobacteria bacterium]